MSKKKTPPHEHKGTPAESVADAAPPSRARPFRAYHAAVLGAVLPLVAALYWLGCETNERYRFNLLRNPQLAQESQWARMTGWLPLRPRQSLTRLVLGSLPLSAPGVVSEYVNRLDQAEEIFPYDGLLQLELSRKLYEQVQQRGGRHLDQAIELVTHALKHNEQVFKTYFDVEAYGQMAWLYMELHGLQVIGKRSQEAAESLRAAREGFHRVVALNPADVGALERLAYVYSYIATASKRREDWLVLLEYAKKLLDAQHDNTNAFYFIGIAYENLDLRDKAVTYYLKTLNYPSTLPADKRMWDRKIIVDHLIQTGYTKPLPPESKPPAK